jgi:small multidrug resistance family-3 protein
LLSGGGLLRHDAAPWLRVAVPPLRTSSKCLSTKLLYSRGIPEGDNKAMKTVLLFIATALAEIIGCYLPYLWLKQGRSAWLLVPGALGLALFAWLLALHETAAGRVYAAYGGVYIGVAIVWLWAVDKVRPSAWDVVGVTVALVGMTIIMFQPRA